jgi:hypothetical protein
VAQRRFIVVVSGPSRLAVYLPGKGAGDLPRTFADALAQVLVELDLPPAAIQREVAASREVVVAATDSRSVLGSLNEAAYLAQYRLRVEPEEDLLVLARWVAETPVIAGSVRWPRDVVRQLLIGPNDEPTG